MWYCWRMDPFCGSILLPVSSCWRLSWNHWRRSHTLTFGVFPSLFSFFFLLNNVMSISLTLCEVCCTSISSADYLDYLTANEFVCSCLIGECYINCLLCRWPFTSKASCTLQGSFINLSIRKKFWNDGDFKDMKCIRAEVLFYLELNRTSQLKGETLVTW